MIHYFDLLEKGTNLDAIVLYDDDSDSIFEDVKKVAKPLIAAGGIVFNDKDKLLTIFRKGFWDLPKGGLNSGETKKQAAVREVMEETGLKQLELGKKAGKTYHIFKNKNGRSLKISHWYYMKSNQVKLVPQEKEMIFDVKWIEPGKLYESHLIYASIEDFLKRIEVF
ncbi:MAG: NUDIX domain-containing protein [Saprospiraceae bacterium]